MIYLSNQDFVSRYTLVIYFFRQSVVIAAREWQAMILGDTLDQQDSACEAKYGV